MNNRLQKLFLELVQIDSPSGAEDEICEYLIRTLADLRLSPVTDSYGNIIVKVRGIGSTLLLSAHVDTVDPGRGVVPVVQKGIVRSEGETILGADNKVGVTIILDLLRRITQGGKPTRNLEIVFTRSEEVGNYGAVQLDYSLLNAKRGYIFDNPNPVGTIITAAPFYNRFDITLQGKAIHASKPELGIHALTIATHALQNIMLGKVDDITTVNIGVIQGGHVRNTIMGDLTLKGEVRSFAEVNLTQATDVIIGTFQDAVSVFGGNIIIDVVRENGGFYYEPDDPSIQRVKKSMQRLGITPILKEDWGCSDANIFVDHEIKVINLGDGTVETHTPSEHVRVSDMVKLENIVWDLIQNGRE